MRIVSQILVGKELTDLQSIVGEMGEPAYRARQIYRGLYRERLAELAKIRTLPTALREALAGEF